MVFLVVGIVACRSGQSNGRINEGDARSELADSGNGSDSGDEIKKDGSSGVWKLQFEDHFERGKIGDNYNVVAGEWKIDDGWLKANESGSGEAEIQIDMGFSGSQRLEYDARADDPGDLSAVLSSNKSHKDGYFVGFGSDNNERSKLLIQNLNVKTWDARIEPGKTHHVVVERDGQMIRQIVDGEVRVEYRDKTPLTGLSHQRVGFYMWNEGKIDNVKVYLKENGNRTNIVWFIAEDMGPNMVCYGEPEAQTPNFDRFAEQGVRYTNVFSSTPVCSSNRSALVTGMHSTSIDAQHQRAFARLRSALDTWMVETNDQQRFPESTRVLKRQHTETDDKEWKELIEKNRTCTADSENCTCTGIGSTTMMRTPRTESVYGARTRPSP